MGKVYVFHHALGRTAGIDALVDRLRELGHDAEAPDLYEGVVFDDLAAGVAHAEEIGFETVAARGSAAASGDRFAVVGISLGVVPAQLLAQTDHRVLGAVLISSAIPLGHFADRWPPTVALQMHLVEGDPWAEEDIPAARDLATSSGGELHLHPGHGHLVLESEHPDHDPDLAAAIVEDIDRFLRALVD